MAADPTAPNPLINRITFKGRDVSEARSKLDQILEQKEDMAAKRYSAAELERMALEAENETRRLRGEPPRYNTQGDNGMEGEKAAESKIKLMAGAKALLEAGLDPSDVGRMMMGFPPGGGNGNGHIIPQGVGTSLKDTIELINLFVGKKEDQEIKQLLVNMNKRLEAIESGKTGKKGDDERQPPVDPTTYARTMADTVVSWHKALQVISPGGNGKSSAEDIENLKEKNRHEERLQEIRDKKEHDKQLGDTLANIPELLGSGMAKDILGSDDEGDATDVKQGKSDSTGFENFNCPDCKTRIIITPTTGNKIVCPKCRAILMRPGSPEATTAGK